MSRAHAMDPENPVRTFCGKWVRAVRLGEPNCHICLRASINGKKTRIELRSHFQREDGFAKCGLPVTHANFFSEEPTCALCRATIVGRPRIIPRSP